MTRHIVLRVVIVAALVVSVASADVAAVGAIPPPQIGTFSVAPSTDLVDGQVVTVGGDGWAPNQTRLDLAICTEGPGDCDYSDTTTNMSVSTDAAGSFSVSFTVRAAVFDTGHSPVDCRSVSCRMVLYDNDYRRVLAQAPVEFRADGPLLLDPQATVTPDAGLVDGQMVTISGTGWEPDRQLFVKQCHADGVLCPGHHVDAVTDDAGAFSIDYRVRSNGDDHHGRTIDCRTETCQVFVTGRHNQVVIPLAFDPAAPPLPAPTVHITPDHDLVAGQEISVEGSGYFPGQELVYGQCNSTLYLDPPQCYDGNVTADANGDIAFTTYAKPAIYAYHSTYPDCRPDNCRLGISEMYDWYMIASTPVGLLPEGDEHITAGPTADLRDGQTVSIDATGLNRGFDVQVAECVVANPQYPLGWCSADPANLPVDDAGELHTTFTVRDQLTAQFGDPPESFDCRVDECQLIVGGEGVRYHPDYYGRYYHWEGFALSFEADTVEPADPADPTAVQPRFTG